MDNLATVVIPISSQHEQMGIYKEAVQSVENQTLPTDIIVIHDKQGCGAGWARNQGSQKVVTPFVIYLDADDTLHPEFVERTVPCYQRGSFVYTDWVIYDKVKIAPPTLSPLEVGQQHIITTLLPIAAWRDSGGFDEHLPALEDEDFYRKIAAYGWCGVKCDAALVTYRRRRGFSKVNRDTYDPDQVDMIVKPLQVLFDERYGKFAMLRNCQKQSKEITAINQRQPNDILCEALYSPMRQIGAATRRSYPRAGLGEPLWVDIEDAKARPDLFRRVAANPDKISPNVERIMELYKRAKQAKKPPLQVKPVEIKIKNNYQDMPMHELWKIIKERELEPKPTGKRGRYKKADLVSVLS